MVDDSKRTSTGELQTFREADTVDKLVGSNK